MNKYNYCENITCLKLDITNKGDYKKIENIDIEKIIPNIYQPRIKFEERNIKELSK